MKFAEAVKEMDQENFVKLEHWSDNISLRKFKKKPGIFLQVDLKIVGKYQPTEDEINSINWVIAS